MFIPYSFLPGFFLLIKLTFGYRLRDFMSQSDANGLGLPVHVCYIAAPKVSKHHLASCATIYVHLFQA